MIKFSKFKLLALVILSVTFVLFGMLFVPPFAEGHGSPYRTGYHNDVFYPVQGWKNLISGPPPMPSFIAGHESLTSIEILLQSANYYTRLTGIFGIYGRVEYSLIPFSGTLCKKSIYKGNTIRVVLIKNGSADKKSADPFLNNTLFLAN